MEGCIHWGIYLEIMNNNYITTIYYRKVADVRREKELAERRKNEPQLGSSQDHLVRKIFSKFRRAQQAAQLTKDGSQTSDVEKGDTDGGDHKAKVWIQKSLYKIVKF
jgi:hypothetical protein